MITSKQFINAVIKGEIDTVKEYLAEHSDVNTRTRKSGRTALHIAAWCNHIVLAKLLIQSNANVNLKDAAGWTALHYAAMRGRSMIATFLIRAHAIVDSVDVKKKTPLMYAIKRHHIQVIRVLLQAGAIYPLDQPQKHAPQSRWFLTTIYEE